MPNYSPASIAKLETCHTDLQLLFNEVIKDVDCAILVGYRGQAEQEAAFAAGNSKLHYPHGKHNSLPSCAVDVAITPIEWGNTKRQYWFAGYVLGIASGLLESGIMKHGIRWGGQWSGGMQCLDQQGLQDLVHFEIVL